MGSGKSGDKGNRKRNKHHSRENSQQRSRPASKGGDRRAAVFSIFDEGKIEKAKGRMFDRPKWTPPKPPPLSMPQASCPWCEKPIKDIMSAICDPETGVPVHFDCVISRITAREILGTGDSVGYIGGGRFGIIHHSNPANAKNFKIKKIFEWENKEKRGNWREAISNYFSAT